MDLFFGLFEYFCQKSPSDKNPVHHPPNIQRVLDFLQLHTELFRLLRDPISDVVPYRGTLIRGCVQSGKSNIMFALCLLYTMCFDMNVVVLLRDITKDYLQFQRNFHRFLDTFTAFCDDEEDIDVPRVWYAGNLRRQKTTGDLLNHTDLVSGIEEGRNVILCLGNTDQVSAVRDCLDMARDQSDGEEVPEVICLVDEADQILYREGDRFLPSLDALLERVLHYYGITATIFGTLEDPSERFSTDHVYYLEPPEDYKGINKIRFEHIESVSEKNEKDEDLFRFLHDHKDREPFTIQDGRKHPMITLIKTERLVARQEKLMDDIRRDAVLGSVYTIITYNGTTVRVYSKNLEGRKMILPGRMKRKKETRHGDGYIHIFPHAELCYVLDYLIDNGGATLFPRILIISHLLVDRGLNICSSGFEWHLTNMFYRPSKTSSVTSMIQSMRLQGIYRDNIPLTCHVEKSVYESLYRGHMLQEDFFVRLKGNQKPKEEMSLMDWVETQTFHKEKIPKRRLFRQKRFGGRMTCVESEDDGMDLEEFQKDRCLGKKKESCGSFTGGMDEKEWRRLTDEQKGMFKKWADLSNDSAIARFMREGLDPVKRYTRKEMSALCHQYRIQLSHLCNPIRKKSQTHGFLLQKDETKKEYRLHESLVDAFHQWF